MNLQHWVFLLFLITYVDNSIISFFKTNIKVKTENIHFMYFIPTTSSSFLLLLRHFSKSRVQQGTGRGTHHSVIYGMMCNSVYLLFSLRTTMHRAISSLYQILYFQVTQIGHSFRRWVTLTNGDSECTTVIHLVVITV